MKKIITRTALGLLALLLLLALGLTLHVRNKLPQRDGQLALQGLQAPVQVSFDERGVPHIQAANEADLYRTLGYVHAQDRLFQMELMRRLANGELAEVLGPKLLETDKLFRTLGLREHARQTWPKLDAQSPPVQALQAYLGGVNAYQDSHSRPLEFEILGIKPRPFTPEDTLAISGYLAYSFAAAFRTEPVLSQVRDQLGAAYLKVFDLNWYDEGVLENPAKQAQSVDWQGLNRLAGLSDEAMRLAAVPLLEGSNAWAVSGRLTQSGKPLLAGDPHIGFSLPAVWYEAHLQSPGFELYGYFQALNPLALIGHNQKFGWSLTMFQNDDVDLIAEKVNPANPKQVWINGAWADVQERSETIAVKGQAPETLTVQRSSHGPILNPAFNSLGSTPVAMWWAFLEAENPLLQAFYELNRANTLDKARQAASLIHSPGLNVVWANAEGDIGWWAAAKIPLRPSHVQPAMILNGATEDADKTGWQDFALNPQEENPERGYIASANHQPTSETPVAGYYNLPDRGRRLHQAFHKEGKWDTQRAQALQLDSGFDFPQRVLQPLAADLNAAASNEIEKKAVATLLAWDGDHRLESVPATFFNQFLYELLRAAMADELGDEPFKNLLRTRAVDQAVPRLAADATSPWWDKRGTEARETRAEMVQEAWRNTWRHLQTEFGTDVATWTWGRAHTLTHKHPLGQQKPLDKIFNVGPFPAPGGHETPNNLSHVVGPAPWAVTYGPSTRRVVDFAQPEKAQGINPVGQSGVWPDAHYADQAALYMAGKTTPQWIGSDVAANTRSTLRLVPR